MPKILQLKINLVGSKPDIWRRFLVEDSITFHKLHKIIQKVMGWEDYHLYEFCIGNSLITSEEDGFNPAEGMFKHLFNSPEFHKMVEQQDLKKGSANLDINKLNKILKKQMSKKSRPMHDMNARISELIKSKGQKFSYLYDFGDNWKHLIVVEKILEKDSGKYPVCIAGERACPPEDCGGIFGYYEMLKILLNKNHPEYKHWKEWAGKFDPEEFDLDKNNKRFRHK